MLWNAAVLRMPPFHQPSYAPPDAIVAPGFIDPHVHIVTSALLSGFINVGALVCDTIDDVMAKLKAGAEAAAPGAWVMAKGFDPSLTKGNANITRRELDAVAPNNPLFMLNASGHLAYVNSKAIELSGVTEATPDPGAGGHYFKGPDGKLTGQLAGGTSYAPFLRLAPQSTPQSLQPIAVSPIKK